METISNAVLTACKEKLIEEKANIINRLRSAFQDYSARDRGGDESDQAVDMLAEGDFLNNQDRLRHLLVDIETALGKMEQGTYGICEETDEIIEANRLLAIPWTRLSIEGAEIRDDLTKRFTK